MDLKILEERANPLLKRIEYTFEVDHAGASTPPRADLRKELAKLVKVPASRLIIERMHARYGAARTRGEAMAYQSDEAVKATVREHILVRNGLKERAPKPGAAPAVGGAPAQPPAAPKADEKKATPPKE